MRIGVPKEIKVLEDRVGLVPASVRELVAAGHELFVESHAGRGIGAADDDFSRAGATILANAEQVFERADLIVKVKEPQPSEYQLLRRDQVLFTFLHLAADSAQADALCKSGVTALAYETVTADDGSLPLLMPMSEIAGRMSMQVGAYFLQRANGGKGLLLGGVPGVRPANVLILGGGVAGTNAAEMAVGLRANVTVVDKSVARLRTLAAQFGNRITTVFSTTDAIETLSRTADLIIGAVLVAGDEAPKLLSRSDVGEMAPGSVVVDIAIDQGGCFETSRETTHAEPTFVECGVVHYCVTNMPGAVAQTSAQALNNVTLPFVEAIGRFGWEKACKRNSHLANGLNVHGGKIIHPIVAAALRDD